MVLRVIPPEHTQCVAEGLPAPRIHLAILTPARLRVVEARPRGAHRKEPWASLFLAADRVDKLDHLFAQVARIASPGRQPVSMMNRRQLDAGVTP